MEVVYTKSSIKDLKRLLKKIRERILKKIDFFISQKDFLGNAKALKGFGKNVYRFRIGEYRVIFRLGKKSSIRILLILRIKHRKDIYFR